VPFLIPIAASVGGSLLGNKLAKAGTGPTKTEQGVLSQDAQAQKTGLNAGTAMLPQANNLIGMGSGAYQPVLNYWSSILSGNRGAATSAMAPELSRISQGYKTAGETSTALSPRGGPSAEFNAELPFQQQRDVTSLLQGARPAAAKGLLDTGNATFGAGSDLLSHAISAIYGSTAAGRDILANQQNIRAQQKENSKSIGQGLFDLIQRYGPDIKNKITGLLHSGSGLGSAGAGDIPSGGAA